MPSLTVYLLVAASWWKSVVSDRFDQCKIRFERILNGTEIYGPFNNKTILSSGIIYNGPVQGMKPEFAKTSRDKFLTVTTDGCRAICGNSIDWYWSSDVALTLSIISNWVLPILALLAAFPFDSIHKSHGRFWGTMCALFNWLGSPQLALTTITFSIYQNVICSQAATTGASNGFSTPDRQSMEAQARGNADTTGASNSDSASDLQLMEAQARKNAYYVLCCMSQYRLQHRMDLDFLEALIYGLITPFRDMTIGQGQNKSSLNPARQEKAQQWTTELLEGMASQLRVLRRRGVYPAFLSILLFCIAYAISLVMAFANIGDRTTTHSLAVGILFSWLPNLLLFAIIDRNPISAERSRTLFIRWIWNVKAVKKWESTRDPVHPGDPQNTESLENTEYRLPSLDFGPRPQHNDIEPQRFQDSTKPHWWAQTNEQQSERNSEFPLGEFIGQGREIGFNGLADAVAHGIRNGPRDDSLLCAECTEQRLRSRPGSWWWLSLLSLLIVWLEISMAFMISYNIPTVGVGCRSGSYLIYGCLSTIPWLINALPSSGNPGNPSKWRKRVTMGFCMLSTLWLLFILFAAFSGILKNCWCRGGHRGYLDFENAQFYRDKNHFDVVTYWRVAAVVGAFPMMVSLLAAWTVLREMKPLWQIPVPSNLPGRHPRADATWLS
ncbi:hypothetical protein B0O99DRAFT_694636 [Bisporella sp. PMI_857]|nr:hypothetical protein B0O99DRAFT_694636 [Bisporella sp. PMI_857]